ncbi:hypothetical protein DFJ73DRAFT_795521 [Zopfochytrium polystomum]|nr:hypothetical protein DFJ73DRAFT_795521 [Zopfochytrium polystomum]
MHAWTTPTPRPANNNNGSNNNRNNSDNNSSSSSSSTAARARSGPRLFHTLPSWSSPPPTFPRTPPPPPSSPRRAPSSSALIRHNLGDGTMALEEDGGVVDEKGAVVMRALEPKELGVCIPRDKDFDCRVQDAVETLKRMGISFLPD